MIVFNSRWGGPRFPSMLVLVLAPLLVQAFVVVPPQPTSLSPSPVVDQGCGGLPRRGLLLPVSRRDGVRRRFRVGDRLEVGGKEVPQDKVDEIEDPAAKDMLQRIQSWEVTVPAEVADGQKVRVTGVAPVGGRPRLETPAVVLLHGFDSSCLEYRRLHPLLEGEVDVFSIDMLGWGFSQLSGVRSFSAESKRAYLYGFWNDVLQRRPMVLVGASLGGAMAIDFAHAYPEAVAKMAFINPQAFIDGLGTMAALPKPLARLGINVLKSVPLRSYAGQLSYHEPQVWSTDDACRIGRLHCLRDGWEEASVDYMLSGGYTTTDKVSAALSGKPVLVLWGKQDRILELSVAQRLREEVEGATLAFVQGCGHVAHLEKPRAAANAILDFVLEAGAWEGTSTGLGLVGRSLDCVECLDKKVVPCPNCDGQGWYESYDRRVDCKACRTTGLVICRSCFSGDPEDVEAIRATVRDAAQRMGRPPPKVIIGGAA